MSAIRFYYVARIVRVSNLIWIQMGIQICKRIWKSKGISISETTLGRILSRPTLLFFSFSFPSRAALRPGPAAAHFPRPFSFNSCNPAGPGSQPSWPTPQPTLLSPTRPALAHSGLFHPSPSPSLSLAQPSRCLQLPPQAQHKKQRRNRREVQILTESGSNRKEIGLKAKSWS
jgi:hypothetical protein